jgi:hypothetical protein
LTGWTALGEVEKEKRNKDSEKNNNKQTQAGQSKSNKTCRTKRIAKRF